MEKNESDERTPHDRSDELLHISVNIRNAFEQVELSNVFASDQSGEEQENESEIPQIPLLPGKHSLFQMLSVYGTNQMLQDEEAEEVLSEQIAKWESGGIYRILSCGKPFMGTQIVIVWLTVRFAPESKTGYEVLYRKIL